MLITGRQLPPKTIQASRRQPQKLLVLLHQRPHSRRRIRRLSLSQIPGIQRNLILKTETRPFGSLRAFPQPLPNGHLPCAVLQILREWPLRRRSIMRGKQSPRRRITRPFTPQSIRISHPTSVPTSTTRRHEDHHQSVVENDFQKGFDTGKLPRHLTGGLAAWPPSVPPGGGGGPLSAGVRCGLVVHLLRCYRARERVRGRCRGPRRRGRGAMVCWVGWVDHT